MSGRPVIVVHGGCGGPRHDGAEHEDETRAALVAAVGAARAVLDAGGTALDAAQRAVESLEACPLFNAGTGSALTVTGEVEMDAALMDGRTGRAGAVAAVRTPRHAVALARAVLEHSAHTMLVGEGADAFAAAHGVDIVAPGHHVTERRRARRAPSPGTVGAVVLDGGGGLAAATSTGGTDGQLPGRVGDSPLIGAGTYADDRLAVSGTGHGESLIRAVAAHEVAALHRHAGLPLAEAADRVVGAIEQDAGLIAIDAAGAVVHRSNTARFNRAWQVGDSAVEAAL